MNFDKAAILYNFVRKHGTIKFSTVVSSKLSMRSTSNWIQQNKWQELS
jgi:hypothetical protein